MTDEGTAAQLAFNIQWHYALNITDESDDAKYMSLKTLWNFRQLVTDFWINGSYCEPLFFVTTEANNSLLSTVENEIIP